MSKQHTFFDTDDELFFKHRFLSQLIYNHDNLIFYSYSDCELAFTEYRNALGHNWIKNNNIDIKPCNIVW